MCETYEEISYDTPKVSFFFFFREASRVGWGSFGFS